MSAFPRSWVIDLKIDSEQHEGCRLVLNGYELSIVGSQVAVRGPDSTVARSLARRCCQLLNSQVGMRWRGWLATGEAEAVESVRQQMLAWLSAEEAGPVPEPADEAIRKKLYLAGLPVTPGTSNRLARRRLAHFELAREITHWLACDATPAVDDETLNEQARLALRNTELVRELHTLMQDDTFQQSQGRQARLAYLSDHYPKLLAGLRIPAATPLKQAS